MELDLLLLGKTGAGKSATGNSILGVRAFSTSSATIKSQREVTELENGRRLRIVDTPGVGDTRGTEAEGRKLFIDAFGDAISLNTAGYHALLLVLRFGNRLTKEDVDLIAYLKSVVGEKFVQRHGIMIMTYGDDFRNKQEDGDIEVTFEEWCKQQDGYFKEIYDEVNGRIILFDNRKKSDVRDQQRQQLVSMVDQLMVGGRRYASEKFEKAKKARENVLLEMGISKINDKVREETSIILSLLEKIKENQNADYKIDALKRLMERIHKLLEDIIQEQNKKGLLLEVQAIILQVQTHVEQELKRLQIQKELEQKKKDRLEMQRENERLRIQLAQQSQSLDQKTIDRLEDAERERERLREQLADCAREEKQSRKAVDKLQSDYNKMRDDYNNRTAPKEESSSSCCVM